MSRLRGSVLAAGLAVVGQLAAGGCGGNGDAVAPGDDLPTHTDLVRELEHARLHAEPGLLDVGTGSARRHLLEGWSHDERSPDGTTFAWTVGDAATIGFFLARPREIAVELRCWPFAPPGHGDQRLAVAVNGDPLGALELAPSVERYTVTVAAEALRRGDNVLRLEPALRRSPAGLGLGADERQLGVAVDLVHFVGTSGRLPSADVAAGTVEIPVGARVDFDVIVPAGAELRTGGVEVVPAGEDLGPAVAVVERGGATAGVAELRQSGEALAVALPAVGRAVLQIGCEGPAGIDGHCLLRAPRIAAPDPQRTALRFEAADPPGFPTAPMYSFGPAWGYLDGDDAPDLYVPHHYGHAAHGLVDVLLVNTRDGGFRRAPPPELRLDERFPRDQHAAVWASLWGRDPRSQDLYQSVGGRRGEEALRDGIEYLVLANRDGTLVNRAIEAGIQQLLEEGPLLRGRVALPLDADRDGETDLLLTGDASPVRLLLRRGDRFEDVTVAAGLARVRPRGDDGWRGTVADLDADGFEDLVLPGPHGLDVYANRGGVFAARLELAPELGRVASVFPLDGPDGLVDLAVLPVALGRERPLSVLVNRGGWSFDVIEHPDGRLAGRGLQIDAGDLDNDGDLDLVVVTRERLHVLEDRGADGYLEVTEAAGLEAIFNAGRPGRFGCAALADYDFDGRLDLVAVRGRGGPGEEGTEPGPLLLARNVGAAGAAVHVRLAGEESDPAGLGAVVTVVDGDRESSYRVRSGVTGTCQNDPALHLGIGAASAVDLVVDWPSGRRTLHTGVGPGARLVLAEMTESAEGDRAGSGGGGR